MVFMFQTSKLVSWDISVVSIFIQFVRLCPCSVFQFEVEVFLGVVAWLPCTSDFLRWRSYAMSLFSLIKPRSLFSSNNVSKRWRTFSSYWSFSSKRQWRKMHILWSSRSTTYSYSRCVMCTWVCVNNAADCAIIPYHLKCIMRSPEMPLISLCLMVSVNFSQLREKYLSTLWC